MIFTTVSKITKGMIKKKRNCAATDTQNILSRKGKGGKRLSPGVWQGTAIQVGKEIGETTTFRELIESFLN